MAPVAGCGYLANIDYVGGGRHEWGPTTEQRSIFYEQFHESSQGILYQ